MRTTIAALLAGTVLLAGCTSDPGGSAPPDPDPDPTAEAARTTDPPPGEAAVYDYRRFDALPDDAEPQLITTIKEKADAPPSTDWLNNGGVVFGDDVAVMVPESQLLTAVSLDDGTVLWQKRLPKYEGRRQSLCPLSEIPPGATTVAVMMGTSCGVIVHYDLEDGSVAARDFQKNYFGQASVNARFSLGRYTYFIDTANSLYRFGGDGSKSMWATASALGLEEGDNVFAAMPIAGSDVVVLRVTARRGLGVDPPIEYVGVRLAPAADAEVLWRKKEKALARTADPGGELPLVEDRFAFVESFGGSVESVVKKGINTPRLNQFDPETGALDSGLLLRRDPEGGFPAWADPYGDAYVMPLADAMVAASGRGGFGGFANVTWYDYTTGEVRWSWINSLPKGTSPNGGDVIGLSTDGSKLYLEGQTDLDTTLFEVDAETGEELRSWPLDDAADQELSTAKLYIHGDKLILMDSFVGSGRAPVFAAVFQL